MSQPRNLPDLSAVQAATMHAESVMADPDTSLMQRFLAVRAEMEALPEWGRTEADREPEAAA